MMENIRTAANSVIVKIIFGVIILAFIFTGVGGFLGFGGSSADDERLYIAKVDGEGISRAAFEREAQLATQNTKTLSGDDSFQKLIRQSILNNQIDNYLSYKLANTLNNKITDQQVKDAIRTQKVFFENGSFSNKRYLELLAANNYTPENYAEALRSSMQPQQVINSLLNSEFVLPIDFDIFSLQNQERTVYTAPVTLRDVIDPDSITITDEDALNYYENNQESFFNKERVKIKYIRLNKIDYENAILIKNIPDEDAKIYYNTNKQKYVKPLMHSYRFIELDDKMKAETLLKQLKQGADFSAKVKEFSLSPSMSDMGWFSIDNKAELPQFIIDANLNKKGQLALIEDNGSYIILKLDNIEKEQQSPFSLVAYKVKVDIWREKVDANYNNDMNRLKASLDKGFKTIEEVAEDADLQDKIYESEWNYVDEAKSLSRIIELRDAIFDGSMFDKNGSTGKITDIIHNDHYDGADYVMQVIEYQPEGVQPFDIEKSNVIDKMKNVTKQSQFKEKIQGITEALNRGEHFDFINFAQKQVLTRDSTKLNTNMIDMVFSLVPPSPNKETFGSYISSDSSALMAVLVNTKNPTLNTEQKENHADEIYTSILKNVNFYLANELRSKAKIEIMPDADL